MKKIIILTIACLLLAGCWTEVGGFFGANTPTGENSPATTLFGSLGPLLPGGLGLALLGLGKLTHGALKTKKALFESTGAAIPELVDAKTPEEVKKALNHAQNLHISSGLIKSAYDKFKNGGIFKKILKRFV